MPKYWGKQIFTNGSFPEVGQKQKTEKKRKKKKGPKVVNNNGQLRIANATLGGACKPPGPKQLYYLSKTTWMCLGHCPSCISDPSAKMKN